MGFFVSGFQDRSPDLRISRDSRIPGFEDSMDVSSRDIDSLDEA